MCLKHKSQAFSTSSDPPFDSLSSEVSVERLSIQSEDSPTQQTHEHSTPVSLAHYLDLAHDSDCVLELHNGKLVETKEGEALSKVMECAEIVVQILSIDSSNIRTKTRMSQGSYCFR